MNKLSEYRQIAMSKIVNSQKIKDYLLNTSNSVADGKTLLMKNVFPFWKIPNIKTTAANYIVMSVNVPSIVNDTFKCMSLKIGILCHENMIECSVDGKKYLRYDLIAEEIDELFNKNKDLGFKLHLTSVQDYNPVESYNGLVLMYNTEDFN